MTEITPASAEGAATPAERPALPHIGCQGAKMSFDISVKVDTALLAKVIGESDPDVRGVAEEGAHTVEHAMVAAFLNRVFEGSLVMLEAKPDVLINEGNGGFHIVTLVTDGYGNLVLEDQRGKELHRERVTGADISAEDMRRVTGQLMDKFWDTAD